MFHTGAARLKHSLTAVELWEFSWVERSSHRSHAWQHQAAVTTGECSPAQDGASPNKTEPQYMRERSVPSVFKWQLLEKFRNESHNITFEYLLVCFVINIFYYYCLYVSVLVNAVCVQMPREARRGHCISWNWHVSCAKVVRMELGSYGNAASTLNGQAMSPAQGLLLANKKSRRGPALCCWHLSLKHPFTSPPNLEADLHYVLRRLFCELTAERSRSDSVVTPAEF